MINDNIIFGFWKNFSEEMGKNCQFLFSIPRRSGKIRANKHRIGWSFLKGEKLRGLRPHTIRKVNFLSKNSIMTKPQHFHEFFTPIFFDNFSRESCQQLKAV